MIIGRGRARASRSCRTITGARAAYDRMLAAGETPLVIDCGANIGLSALYFAQHLPAARIIGVDPARDNVELARKNTQHNPLIEIIEAAVHDQDIALELVKRTDRAKPSSE